MKQKRRLGVQLYSVRNEMAKDAAGTLAKLAGFGFQVLELVDFSVLTPAEFRKHADALGMSISASFSPALTAENAEQTAETYRLLGLESLLFGFQEKDFADLAAIQATAEKAQKTLDLAKKHGMKVSLHNHYWEFERLDGRLKIDYLLDRCPELPMELDTYWCANYGNEDPAALVRRYAGRLSFLHMKDGMLNRAEFNRNLLAVGSGKIDVPAIVAAVPETVRTLVVEIDNCAGDMLDTLKRSHDYLAALL